MVIAEGTVGVSRSGGVPVAVLDAGDFVGEVAMLKGGARSATVTTLSRVEILVCNASEFHRLVATAPSVAQKIGATAEHRIAANRDARAA